MKSVKWILTFLLFSTCVVTIPQDNLSLFSNNEYYLYPTQEKVLLNQNITIYLSDSLITTSNGLSINVEEVKHLHHSNKYYSQNKSIEVEYTFYPYHSVIVRRLVSRERKNGAISYTYTYENYLWYDNVKVIN